MNTNFRLIPKFNENILVILYEYNGDVKIIAQILLPADHQLAGNVATATDICSILKSVSKEAFNPQCIP